MAMTEDEWLACADPYPMVQAIEGKASDRKLRLFACGCLRIVHYLVTDSGRRKMIETAERWADGLVTDAEARAILAASPYESSVAWESGDNANEQAANRTAGSVLFASARVAAETVAWNVPKFGSRSVQTKSSLYPSLLRDVIGNPFRPVTIAPAWRTSNVAGLAEAIYADLAFDRLPILADALEDAGCANGDILNHCRQPGEHVRGCWVVDLVLGKD
jgi:hypothetical protein